jgi:hypothetical protein
MICRRVAGLTSYMVCVDIRAVNQLIDYQLIAILIDYFNYQFN